MIFTDRTITVRKGESKINEPIIIYRGDYELEVRFTIMNSKFKFMSSTNLIESENAAYGQLAILTPYGGNIFSDIAKCNDGAVTFVLTEAMLDQIEEVGLYSFQIRLFDYNKESRVSIPPVEFGIVVREPIASEDHDNSINNAIVAYAIANIVDPNAEVIEPTFDSEGNYNKTIWKTGDRITQGKLNRIEDAIDKINQNEINDKNTLNKQMTSNFNVLQSQIDNMVIESGNTDAEVQQARGVYSLLNHRLNAMDETDEELASQLNKIGFINFDYFYNSADNDDDRLLNAFDYCRENKMTLSINRKVQLTKTISYDFTFSIIGNGTSSELFLNSSENIDIFLDIATPDNTVRNTEIKNITINANKKASICTLLRKGKANRFSNVTIKHSTDKEFQIGYDADNKVIELNCDKLYCIGGELVDGAPMSKYNLYIHGGSSDNNFIDVTCINASEANILEEGWSNSWTNIHCYGYPYEQTAKSNFFITGSFGSYNNIQCDTFEKQGIYIQGHYLCFNNIKIQTTLDLYPEAGGIVVYSQNGSSSNLAFNNIMLKNFRTTDTEKYAFDIKFDGTIPRTITISNILNDKVMHENKITNTYSQSVLLESGVTSFKVSLPYELENSNYIIVYNSNFDAGKILLTSKGVKDIWFSLEKNENGGFFYFMLDYKLNS